MAEVTIRFLGSGDAFGSGARFQTCIHVQSASGTFLIDCGASSLIAMKRFGVDPDSIDAILISHLHGDHFGGLPFFILDAQFSRRERPVRIAGPPGVQERVRQTMEIFFPGSSQTPQRFPIEFFELAEGQATAVGPIVVTPYAVTHASGAPAYALRADCDGKTVAYSGDTEWTGTLIEAARDADLFICEAYYFEKQVKFHLDLATLTRHRDELSCRRLVVTHMSSDLLAHLDDIAIEAAEDGKTIVL